LTYILPEKKKKKKKEEAGVFQNEIH